MAATITAVRITKWAAALYRIDPVRQSSQPKIEPRRSEPIQKLTDVLGPAHSDDLDALGFEIPTTSSRERFDGVPIAHAFDENDGASCSPPDDLAMQFVLAPAGSIQGHQAEAGWGCSRSKAFATVGLRSFQMKLSYQKCRMPSEYTMMR